VLLFVPKSLQDAFAEGRRRSGKFEQHQGHKFGGEQFMIAKKMQQLAALGNFFESVQSREIAFAGRVDLEQQVRRTAGMPGVASAGPGCSSVNASGARNFSSSVVANKTCSANWRISMQKSGANFALKNQK